MAGFIEPAAEVGGNYYEILQSDGCVKSELAMLPEMDDEVAY